MHQPIMTVLLLFRHLTPEKHFIRIRKMIKIKVSRLKMTCIAISANIYQKGMPLMLYKPIYNLLSKLKKCFPFCALSRNKKKQPQRSKSTKYQQSSIATAVKNKFTYYSPILHKFAPKLICNSPLSWSVDLQLKFKGFNRNIYLFWNYSSFSTQPTTFRGSKVLERLT